MRTLQLQSSTARSTCPPTPAALLEAGCYVASLRVSRVVFSLGTTSYPRLTPRDKTDWNFRRDGKEGDPVQNFP